MKQVRSAGFSLVEVALALGLAAFCLVALLGLIPTGLSSRQETVQSTVATGIATEVISDLRASQTNSISRRYQIAIPSPGASSTMTTSPQTFYLAGDGTRTGGIGAPPTTGANTSLYRVSIGFLPPSVTTDRSSTATRILITWPAQAHPSPQSWPDNPKNSYEIFTTLNRN